MKFFVEYDEQKKILLSQYSSQIEQLGKGFASVEANARYLSRITGLVKGIEENSIVQLKEQDSTLDSFITEKEAAILAFIGHKQINSQITHYYNMNIHVMKPVNSSHYDDSSTDYKKYCISCFSKNNKMDALGIIKCIKFLSDLSQELNKPLVVCASMGELRSRYSPQRLFYRIINQYLEEVKGKLIIKSPQKNVSIDAEYSSETKKDNYRQSATLYNDPFYLSIDPNEEIYVPLLAEAYNDPQYYESLGFQHIILESGLRILYGKRSDFDSHRERLTGIGGEFRLIILTHPPCTRDTAGSMIPYFLSPQTQRYTGRGVYIGIITSDDIDYTNPVLRNTDGSTRIAYIWEQMRSTQGNIYTAEQINAALASPNPNEIIKLPVGESMSTVMAAISGGWSEALGYRSIAPQAEFLIAKIKPVSESLQRIYGGMPNPGAITMFDALIGLLELGNFAINQRRPLSLLFPFNGNLDSHDAALYTQQEVSRLTKRVGLTIVVPTGDEANKRHHFEIEGEQMGVRTINIEVAQPNQNVLVVIYQRGSTVRTMNLFAPGTSTPLDLRQSAISISGNTTIYSSGSSISFLNGTIRTLFRLENPSVGTWRMELDVNMGVISRIQMWMSQEELNPYIRFNPHNALTTMGATAAIPNIMSVGGYDFNTQTVLNMSGRGDPQNSNIIPVLVTYGKSILAPCTSSEWVGLTGTLPAASIMAGAAAAIYQKYVEETPNQLPNTVVMNSIILHDLIQIEALQYPNPSQGYGIFSLETLIRLLREIVQ